MLLVSGGVIFQLHLGCDIGGAKELGVIYFPTNWGAKEPQNLPNHRVDIAAHVFFRQKNILAIEKWQGETGPKGHSIDPPRGWSANITGESLRRKSESPKVEISSSWKSKLEVEEDDLP